jgi:hypothetical protein
MPVLFSLPAVVEARPLAHERGVPGTRMTLRTRSRSFSARLLGALLLVSATGCVGAVGEAPISYQGPSETDGPKRDAGVDASTGKPDGRVVVEDPEVIDEDPEGVPVIQPEAGEPEPDAAVDTPLDPDLCAGTQTQPLAKGLRITEVALYQTVKVSLYKDGTWVSNRVAPIVQGKKALVRVFVTPLPGYTPRTLRAKLTLSDSTSPTQIIDERQLGAASTDAQLNSTFSFQVDGAKLGGGTQLSVAIEELECGQEVGTSSDARAPESGEKPLEATSIGKLNVVLVPVSVDGRVPVTNDQEVANIRGALLAYYPVPDVSVTVRAPLQWASPVVATDGQTWSNLLNAIMGERRKDAPAANVYYFGLVQPAATFRAYCLRGCVLGLAPQTTTVQTSAQIGLGASFADAQTLETIVHELGHAHGRGHAPCVESGEIDGVDQSFPDKTGATGVWGWDSRSNTLLPPANKDIMGYCEPNWISAYNYSALATRSIAVNQRARIVAAPKGAAALWQHVLLYGDGSARWGGASEQLQPGGAVELADVLDAQGNVVTEVEVVRVALSHSGDEFAYFPEPEAGWAAFRLHDRTVVIDAIQPAL